jgi:5S rRNA maturation endonuclease (ribonuclease M5)
MTPQEIAAALGKAERHGDEWVWLCPAHDDHRPSLSIAERDGKLLVICRAGCDQTVLVNTLRLRGRWKEPPTEPKKRKPPDPIVATYNYSDETDTLCYQVVRTKSKRFWQRRPNGADNSFINGLGGTEPLPYRLPDLLARPYELVFIPEGEKDCENLFAQGLLATCNHGGTGDGKVWAKIARRLTGRRCVVLPDNDATGHRRADYVVSELLRCGCQVRRIELPRLEEKGDVSDWLAAGGTADALGQLVEAAPLAKGFAGPRPPEEELVTTEKGAIIANSQANIKIAIHRLGGVCSYNSFADQMLIEREGIQLHLNEDAMIRLWLEIDEQFGFRPQKDFFRTVVQDYARQKNFHPVCDYLDSLKWDGVPRLSCWLVDYAGAPDTPYCCAVARIVLIAAVRRGRRPGCKFDEMMVLEGSEGGYKSTALEIMAGGPEWFSDDLPLNCDSRRVIESLRGVWIVGPAALADANRAGDRLARRLVDTTTASGAPAASKIRRTHQPVRRARSPRGPYGPRAGVGAADDLTEWAKPRVPRSALPDLVAELVAAWNARWCRPPLDEAEVESIVASIGRYSAALSNFESTPP